MGGSLSAVREAFLENRFSPAAIDPRPIGVFDSGVGGLLVVRALRDELPGEALLYLGDTARLPYGTKSPETVTQYSQANVDWLKAEGAKAVVVACNTASATALDSLECNLPIWGVVRPGAKAALMATRGRVGVIATEATVRSGAYARTIVEESVEEVEVSSVACPLLVPLVEEGWLDDPVTETIARRYLTPLCDWKMDTLVLGCTHYPLLAPLLQRVVGREVEIVDSARSLAGAVRECISEPGLDGADEGNSAHTAPLRLCFTDQSDRHVALARLILGARVVEATRIEWVDRSQ